jgi:geranylgeranyl pyrophosphate synthase
MVTWTDTLIRSSMLPHGPGPLERYLETVRPAINERIRKVLAEIVPSEALGHGLTDLLSQGKRMRAGLLLLNFATFADSDTRMERALDLAAAVEIAHTSSLVVDDIVDGDDLRRGKKAAHVIDGRRKALLGTVGALSIPYSITSRYGGEYTDYLARTHRAMVVGEMAELSPSGEGSTEERYELIIGQKTGQLFALAARFGAMSADCPREQLEPVSRFGLLTGTAVQLADDILDLWHHMSKDQTIGGSELLLQRTLERSRSGKIQSWEDMLDRSVGLLDARITSADHALTSALEKGKTERLPDPLSLSCLRHAPAEMARMMLRDAF